MRNLFATSAVAAILASTATAVYAQETTSSVRGSVTGADGPISGATVTVTHTPSGTTNTVVTGGEGAFVASGLRPGGPYTISVAAPGYATATFRDVSLAVGQPYNLPVALDYGVEELVVTAARRPADPLSSVFNRESIEGVASVARDIRDVARQDPFASFNPVTRGVSIVGANNRTNRFSVDGVRFSDNFGLQEGGLPTGRGPVPLDAIEQLSVKVAPYDITEGDFQGGSINVVLRSGENDFHGSAFYTYTDDSLTGDSSRGTPVNLDMESKNWGAFLSGPILKDRLFFALSYEKLDEVVPAQYGLAGAPNVVPNLDQSTLDAVSGIAQSVYGYDTLGLLAARPETDEKYTAKLDYNFTDKHRLSYTYIHNEGETIALGGGSTNPVSPTLGYQSYATHEPEEVDSNVLQLNSNWTNNFSTELRVNYRESSKIPVSFGAPGFAQFQVCTDPVSAGSPLTCTQGAGGVLGSPRLYFGTEQYSQKDIVGQTQYGAELVGRLSVGNHVIKGQVAYSNLDIENVFVHSSLGLYTFDSVSDFENRQASVLSLQNSITGDLSDLSASFTYKQITLGLQDSWDVTPAINITYGLRGDLYKMDDSSPLNASFVNRYGFANNYNIDGNLVLQPRFNVTWRATDNLTIRGGVGLFSGGAPDVFIGNSFSVAGVYGNTITIERDPTTPTGCSTRSFPATMAVATAQQICQAALNNVTGNSFDPLVLQYLQTNTAALSSSPVNAMSKDFELPSTWKVTLSADYIADLSRFHLGDGWKFGADLYFGKTQNAAIYTDLRLTQVGTAPDGRPIYADTYTNSSNNDLLMTNTSRGHSLVAVVRADKYWDIGPKTGLNTGVSYTYQDIKSVGDMNGTTASGTYGAQPMVDPNYPAYGTSEYEIKHNFKFNADFDHKFFGDYSTRLSMFGEYRSGQPYSLTMNVLNSRAVFGTTGTTSRYLLYVPDVSAIDADPRVTYANVATYEAFRDFVRSEGLGQGIINKNTQRAPDYFKVDLHFEQEIPTPAIPRMPDARIKLFADIENVLNLINDKYGSYRTVSLLSPVVNVSCNTSCTQYTYSNFTPPVVTNQTRYGLWGIRVGAKFEF